MVIGAIRLSSAAEMAHSATCRLSYLATIHDCWGLLRWYGLKLGLLHSCRCCSDKAGHKLWSLSLTCIVGLALRRSSPLA